MGISLSDIARMLGRSPSTIQKQLTGVNPLKPYVKEAIESVISLRLADLSGDIQQSHRSGAPVSRGPREILSANLEGYLYNIEMVDLLLVMYGSSDISELRSMVREQLAEIGQQTEGVS